MKSDELLIALQTFGLRLGSGQNIQGRRGGAGPTDHKAVRIAGTTIMVPVYNLASDVSPFTASDPDDFGTTTIMKNGEQVGFGLFPKVPEFYKHFSSDGIPFWKIAQLHSHNVLATTVLQNCIRYNDKETSCRFCAIGESLKNETTIAFKKPHHLAEVAKAAYELDGIEQFVITTGTPGTPDRGAKILYDSVVAIKKVLPDLPIQVQCEPPNDFGWFQKLKNAGADTLGMHLEAVEEEVRQRIMKGKAEVPMDYYMEAFEAAVTIFGRGQVSTYLLAGLGDSAESLIMMSRDLIEIGVYPFVVPFVPVKNTPLQNHPAPDRHFMKMVLSEVGQMLAEADLTSDKMKSGCGKCGACSTLKVYEKKAMEVIN